MLLVLGMNIVMFDFDNFEAPHEQIAFIHDLERTSNLFSCTGSAFDPGDEETFFFWLSFIGNHHTFKNEKVYKDDNAEAPNIRAEF